MAVSGGYDLCLVHGADADQWSRYVTHHLGREQFRLRLVAVVDRQLVAWITAAAAAAASPCLGELAGARAHIVVVSPGLVESMLAQPMLDFTWLVRDPSTAQVPHAAMHRSHPLANSLYCKSFPPQPFLFLLQDSPHGFPTDCLLLFPSISICYFLVFLFLGLHFLVGGSVR